MITDQEKDHEDLVIKEFLVDLSGSCNEWCDRNESTMQGNLKEIKDEYLSNQWLGLSQISHLS